MRKYLTGILLITCLVGFSSSALAMRCGTKIVTEGDSQASVIAKCGMPFFQSNSFTAANQFNSIMSISTNDSDKERWVYNFGPRDFLYTLTFKNGKLQDIQTDDSYGF